VYRYRVVTSYAPSLTVVGRDICDALIRLGNEAELHLYQISYFEGREKPDRTIVFMTFDPLYCIPWFLLARDYNVNGFPALIYTTVEGYPKREQVPKWFRRDCEFVACSNFVKEMLIDVEQNVLGVVKHGVNLEAVRKVEGRAKASKNFLRCLSSFFLSSPILLSPTRVTLLLSSLMVF